tara:strand:+ start:4850 stop:6223 length:1374 start_codon:yes stop_codon:yes gene_type:complete
MDITLVPAFITLFGATLFVFVGNIVGKFFPVLRAFTLPGAVLGGLLGLLLGPQVLGGSAWPGIASTDVDTFYHTLKQLPGLFINAVFACLMLGRPLEPFKQIWSRAKPQVVMGHLFAWGQYVMGLGLAVIILGPLLGVSELAGPLIAIGFQGGHGTAAGLSDNFSALGFAAGTDLALAVATVGIISGVVGGPFLANVLKRRYDLKSSSNQQTESQPDTEDDVSSSFKPNPLTGRLTVHLALVGSVIFCGWLALQGIQMTERLLRSTQAERYFSDYLPLFSVVLLVGMIFQVLLQSFKLDQWFDRTLFEKISSFALDMVIVSALATLSLDVLGQNWLAISLLCAAGIGWNLALLFVVGPKVYKSPWWAYGLGDLGGGTATTASGIMLINVVDPKQKTDALKAYADKQPFYEPIMGGGLVTALALPTVAILGATTALGIVTAIFLVWAVLAWRLAQGKG